MNNIKKCYYCQKVYFVIEEGEPCPFCGQKDNGLDIFNKIFGKDNPFNKNKKINS